MNAQCHEGRFRCGGPALSCLTLATAEEPADFKKHDGTDEPDAQHGVDLEQVPCDEEED
ncbi:MAG: hypothetical protein RBG13Loki_3952 [Promethearchaeota archaeon CR_4]|nr:MAG: hypothetical protein RBG13Loki_3952 [Candidatus Lokiarchaeota archaeon CR_4]